MRKISVHTEVPLSGYMRKISVHAEVPLSAELTLMLHMGVYDLTRLSGVDLKAKTLFERQAILHETVSFNFKQFQDLRHQQGAPPHSAWEPNVWVFWVGWQEACVNVVAHSTDLPFNPAYICRLDNEEYVKLLTPIKTAWP